MPRVAFATLGCKVNQYETQRILESFEDVGFQVVPQGSACELVVVNSCSVTAVAESKSRYAVRKAARDAPGAKVVVTGCAAQMSLNAGAVFPGADLTVPNPDKLQTLRHVLAAFPELLPEQSASPVRSAHGRTRATLKVQDGCNLMCSYCSIPYTRPLMASRPADQVVAEARSLVDRGFHEVVLTGVLIGAHEQGLPGLILRLSRETGVARIRLSSIEMQHVTPELIELLAEGVLTPHLHIPLQSGDDGILADMGRRYRVADYLALLARVRAALPDVTLTTDVMVGFPTEDEARFGAVLETVRGAEFAEAHVFRFSPRPGTPAERWGDPVPDATKQARSLALQAVVGESGSRHAARFLGRTLRVLVEGKVRAGGMLEGTTDGYLTVRFAGPASAARTFQWVRIDDSRGSELYGELVTHPSPLRIVC